MPRRWYVATVKTNREFTAERELRRQGFRPWNPRVRERLVVRRKFSESVRHVVRPYFPNYMFICFDAERDVWSPIKSTKGITRLIAQGELLVPVRRGVIEALMEQSGELDFLIDERVEEVIRNFSVGDEVKVTDGPFSGFVGPISKMTSEKKIEVMLEVFGRSTKVVLSPDQAISAV